MRLALAELAFKKKKKTMSLLLQQLKNTTNENFENNLTNHFIALNKILYHIQLHNWNSLSRCLLKLHLCDFHISTAAPEYEK